MRAGARQEVWFGLMDPKTKTKTDCVTDTRSADGEVYLGRAKHSEYCPVLEVPAAPTLQSSPGRQTTETAEAGSGGRHQEKKGTLWAHTRGGRRACTGPAQRRVATFVMHATQHREGQRWGGRGPIETGRGPLPRRSAAGAGLTQMGPPLQARPGCGGAVDKGGGGRARARFCLRRPPTSSTVVVVVVALAGPQWCGRAVPQP